MNYNKKTDLLYWIIDLVHSTPWTANNFCCLFFDKEKNNLEIYTPENTTLLIFDFLETCTLFHGSLKNESEKKDNVVEIIKTDSKKISITYSNISCAFFCDSLTEEEIEAVVFLFVFLSRHKEDAQRSNIYLNVLVEQNFSSNKKLMFLKKEIIEKFKNSVYAEKNTQPRNTNLSQRELEVLKLFCEEKTAKEIGREINISPRTVEAIKDKLVLKLNTKTTLGLMRFEYLC